MAASTYVGRVGGLAIALGIGAAAFGGTAVAWADAPAGADTSSSSEAVRQGHDGGSAGASTRSTAKVANNRSGGNALPAASARPRVTIPQAAAAHGANRAAVAVSVPAGSINSPAPVAAVAPAAVAQPNVAAALPKTVPAAAVVASTSARVAGFVTALADPLSDLSTGGPAAPVGSPVAWTVLEYTRRNAALAKPAAAVPASAVPAASLQVADQVLTLPLILGPSGVPIPSDKYVANVMNLYVRPGSGLVVWDDPQPEVIYTPEGLYPITGVKSLPLDASVDQGLTILSNTLAGVQDGTPVTVFGYSQSAIIGSLLQAGYVPPNSIYPDPVIPEGLQDSINFVFVGNEMNPNGGFLSRFPGLNMPSLGIPFYGATPEDAYPTTNYTLEYDGFADFPRYPLNFLSVLNAGMGIVFVHTQYANPNVVTEQRVADAIQLPSTSPTQNYFFMPTENLPLLEPLRLIPFIGNPLADLIQPVLKVIVDLGYGDPAHGFASAVQPDANVQVPFGLFPEVNPLEVLGKLAAGVQQGVSDFFSDFGPGGSVANEISAIATPVMNFMAAPSVDGLISAVQNFISTVADRITAAAAGVYAALLPTADIINALVTTLPAYDAVLALDGVQQAVDGDLIGGVINAVGLPIAADVGLATTAGLVGVLVWLQAALAVVAPNVNLG